jgi:hypothetical protein
MNSFHRPIALSLATLSLSLLLVACSGSGTPATTAGADLGSAPPGASELQAKTDAEHAAELAAREQDVARREADLAAREAATAQAKKSPPAVAKSPPRNSSPRPAASSPTPAPSQVAAASAPPPLVVPAGTPIHIALLASVTTQTARPGDPVEAQVSQSVMIDGQTAIAAGTPVHGVVTEVISGSAKIGGTPTLGLRFDAIEIAPGKTAGVNGSLRELGKSDTGRDTAKIAGGALAGAIIGKQVGDNKGRLIGGLLGGAAGAVAAKKTGTEIVLPEGSAASVTLDSALTIR